jgi:hypothetical protein
MEAETDGTGLPRFVVAEVEAFLRCGILAHGFVRLACEACHEARLVAFSCKRRGFCPGCIGRRMSERAAHLVDNVLPRVPVRQWVLTVPHGLRYRMAHDPSLTTAVLAVLVRAVSGWLKRRARRLGVAGPLKTGAVTVIQRFDSALALNVHFHSLVLDGVYALDRGARPVFHPTPPPTDAEVAAVATSIHRKVYALVNNEEWGAEPASALATCASASITRVAATGPRRGSPLRRIIGEKPPPARILGRRCAQIEGFNLHANTRVAANQRDQLETLCRYLARPPLSDERLKSQFRPDSRPCCVKIGPK